MAFDYAGAKKAGVSDDQILDYLNKTRGYDVQGALKAGASKNQVISYLATTQSPQPQPEPKEKKGMVDRVVDFVGARGIVNQFGSSLARARASDSEDQFIEDPSLKEVVGSAIQTGANLIPGVGAGAKLATKIGAGAATGLAFDVGGKLQDDKTVSESLTPGAGTAVGVALPILGRITGLSGLGKNLGNLSERLEQTSLRLTPVEKQNLEKQGKDIVKYLADKKIVGTPETRYAKIDRIYDGMEDQVTKVIENSGIKYDKSSIIEKIKMLPEKFSDDPAGYGEAVRQVNAVIKFLQSKAKDQIDAGTINAYKRKLFKRSYSKNNTDVTNEALHAVASLLKGELDSSIKPLQKLNEEYSKIITARKILFKAQTRNQLGLTGKLVSAGAGGIIGSMVGGPIGGAAGSIIGPTIGETVAGTAARSVTGAAAKTLGDLVSKLPTDKAGNVSKKALMNLIQGLRD